MYSSELPADLTVPLAKELLSATQANPKLSDLSSICRSFIDAHDLKLRKFSTCDKLSFDVFIQPIMPSGLMQLVDEILSGMERGKKLVESTDMTNPAKVLYAGKQIAREAVSSKSPYVQHRKYPPCKHPSLCKCPYLCKRPPPL